MEQAHTRIFWPQRFHHLTRTRAVDGLNQLRLHVVMPSVLSRLALPYGVAEDYRIDLATFTGRQRGRVMHRGAEAHPISFWDTIMPFPDYGIVVVKLGYHGGTRVIRVALHAGGFSDRRFARYAREVLAGQMTRLQAHHSYMYTVFESDSPWMFQLVSRLKTGKCSRAKFCNVLDVIQYQQYCVRNGVPF